MKLTQPKKFRLGLLGAFLSAIATSGIFLAISCCAGPLVFASLGFGFAAISKVELLAPYRWIFILFTIFFVAVAFVQLHRKNTSIDCESECSNRNTTRINRALFWIMAAIVIALILFPIAFERYLLQVK